MTNKHKGFSLLELIIAMGLSVVVLLALTSLVIESQRSKATLECIKDVQDSGRAALDIMVRDLSVAGYRGCSSMLSSTFVYQSGLDLSALSTAVQNQLKYELALTVPISGFGGMLNASTPLATPKPMLASTLLSEFDAGGSIDLSYASHPPAQLKMRQLAYRSQQTTFLDGSPVTTPSFGDLITTRSVGSRSWTITGSSTDFLFLASEANIPPVVGDLLYVGDCAKGTVFMVTGVAGPSPVTSGGLTTLVYGVRHLSGAIPGTSIQNLTNDLGGTQAMLFDTGAIVASIDTTHYALGVSPFNNSAGDPIPSLYRSRFVSNAVALAASGYATTPEEIAPGIVDLGIHFGVSNAPDTPPTRLSRMADIGVGDVLQTADLSVQASAVNDCGAGDADNSIGWGHFTMRFERFLRLRNVRGASD